MGVPAQRGVPPLARLGSSRCPLHIPHARIENVPHAVPKDVKAQNGQHQRYTRDNHEMRRHLHPLTTIARHRVPFCGRRLYARPKKAEP
jgi:hypothetical protein